MLRVSSLVRYLQNSYDFAALLLGTTIFCYIDRNQDARPCPICEPATLGLIVKADTAPGSRVEAPKGG
jgi:hypothetical protein